LLLGWLKYPLPPSLLYLKTSGWSHQDDIANTIHVSTPNSRHRPIADGVRTLLVALPGLSASVDHVGRYTPQRWRGGPALGRAPVTRTLDRAPARRRLPAPRSLPSNRRVFGRGTGRRHTPPQLTTSTRRRHPHLNDSPTY
jgi:hypothetical protein